MADKMKSVTKCCPICNEGYSDVQELNKHYNRFHKTYTGSTKDESLFCHVCGKLYARKGHLGNHIRNKHGDMKCVVETNTEANTMADESEDSEVESESEEPVPTPPKTRSHQKKENKVNTPSKVDVLEDAKNNLISDQKDKVKQLTLTMDEHVTKVENLKAKIQEHEAIIQTLEST